MYIIVHYLQFITVLSCNKNCDNLWDPTQLKNVLSYAQPRKRILWDSTSISKYVSIIWILLSSIYISKSWSVLFIVASLVLRYLIHHVIGYIIIRFLIYILFLNFVDKIYTYWFYTFNFDDFNFMYNSAFTYSPTLI